jgi:Holliday junction resolvase RusA-like endonuclease
LGLPNLNDMLYASPMARKTMVGVARTKGYKIGIDIAREAGLGLQIIRRQKAKTSRDYAVEVAGRYLTEKPIFAMAFLYFESAKKDRSRGSRTRDIYNPVLKATIDGLTDAGLWEDDNTDYHTDLWTSYRGLKDSTETLLMFYEILA